MTSTEQRSKLHSQIWKMAKKDYNLSVSSYVEAKDTREKIDIKVLNKEIETVVAKQSKLRKEIDEIVAEIESKTKN